MANYGIIGSPQLTTPQSGASIVTTPSTPTVNRGSNSSTPNASRQVQQKNPKLYKTELCRTWMETGRCNYGERCQYAHGEKEKRPVPRHPKYKTDPCQSYHKTGYCPYGPRCHFIHNESPAQLKTLITANEQALHMAQELAALGIDQKKTALTTSSSAASLGAYASANSNGIYPAQKSASAMPFMNGHHQFLGKAQSFGSNHENFTLSNAIMSQYRQPQQKEQPKGMNFVEANVFGMQTVESNNFNKNLWSNDNSGDFEPKNPNLFDHQRPRTLGIHPGSGFQSLQISPTFLPTNNAFTHEKASSKSPSFQIPFGSVESKEAAPINSMKNLINDLEQHDDLDPQQLLGNLCSSDDEYSRSSIFSSNIDSGNESPLATFDEEARLRQSNPMKCPQLSTPTANLPAAEEPQQRRSSDGDKTSNSTGVNPVDFSTASSSMASLLSSSSTNSGALPQQQLKLRLPVFERLSQNQ